MNTASKTSLMLDQQVAIANGLTTGQLRAAVTNDWLLPEEAQQFLAAYFLRRWHTANLLALLKDGSLHYEDRRYQVQWTSGKVEATSNEYCYLSFRKTNSTSVQSVVLINKENH